MNNYPQAAGVSVQNKNKCGSDGGSAAAPFMQGVKVDDKQYVDCACTKIQQDEHCLVGYPSLLCEICDGKGVVPPPRAQALEEALKLTLSVVKLQNGNLHDDINQIISKAEAALSSQPVADGWLPIETAPKDGTDIQVTGHKYGPRVLTASYGNSGPYDRSKKTYKAGWSYSPGSLIDPTHWRPLPASPGASE